MARRYHKRFFADNSFWNTPIPEQPEIADQNQHYQKLISEYSDLHININEWTIPVYFADKNTPKYKIKPKITECPISPGHFIASQPWLDEQHPKGIHPSAQGMIPIPDEAQPDGENDAHMAIVDVEAGKIYDMWQVIRDENGNWSTNSAIAYDLNGTGVFSLDDFAHVHNNESIHYHGPCRASGVPSVGGLIMHHEIQERKIEHKLAFACGKVALQEFNYPPAIWTDGWLPNGIPEGITMQLDPALDLAEFNLPPAALAVATALQNYGAVLVDFCHGLTMYAEGIVAKQDQRKWDETFTETCLKTLGLNNFRFLQTETVINKGSHPVFHSGISRLFYNYCIDHKISPPPPKID